MAAAEALADVIVGVAGDLDGDALAHERAEGLARAALELDVDGPVGKSRRGVLLGHLVREHAADGAVNVRHGTRESHLLALLNRRFGNLDERLVEGQFQAVVLDGDVANRGAGSDGRGRREDLGEVDAVELIAGAENLRVGDEQIASADEFVDGGVPHGSHVASKVLGEEEEEVDDVVLVSGEFGSELLILRGDSDGAGVLVALAHHDATHRHQRRGGEPPLLGAQQGRDEEIAARLELPVRLKHGAAAEVVGHQRLLRLGETELPGEPRALDPGPSRRAGAAVVAGDENVVSLSLDHARGDGADAVLGHELDADPRARVAVLAVVNQLREVLDGVDVVVRRRGDEPDARGGHAGHRDVALDLGPGELTALAGLGALRHLDLNLVGV